MFQTNIVQKIKAHFVFNNFFPISCHLRDSVVPADKTSTKI